MNLFIYNQHNFKRVNFVVVVLVQRLDAEQEHFIWMKNYIIESKSEIPLMISLINIMLYVRNVMLKKDVGIIGSAKRNVVQFARTT